MRHDRQGGERQRIPCHERELAKEAGVALDQLINVAVAEKLSAVSTARIVCLDIADRYEFMDKTLVSLLEAKVPPHLR